MAMIDKDAAIEIARKRAEENEWGFGGPIHVVEHHGWFGRNPTVFEIRTNYPNFGTVARFTIDARTGEILKEGYVPW